MEDLQTDRHVMNSDQTGTTPATKSRRVDQRLPASKTSISAVQMTAGDVLDLVNISRTGALLEGNTRVCPGMLITLRVKEAQALHLVRGRVIRCSIVGLSEGVLRYRFAVAFEKPIDFQFLPGAVVLDRSSRGADTRTPDKASTSESESRELQTFNSW